MTPFRAVVLISGNGSNLQAIIDAVAAAALNLDIRLVISNQDHATGLRRAQEAGINTLVLPYRGCRSRQEYDQHLSAAIDRESPQLVILAGFMRILSDEFVQHYEGRLINIHPSLLPDFRGLNTHQRVLDAGRQEHGASVHFVVPELDAGPILLQARVPVLAGDDASALAARVLKMEHLIYPLAIRWIAEGRAEMRKQRLFLDGKPLDHPLQYSETMQLGHDE